MIDERDPLERPRSVPAPGEIAPFDSGWDAHRIGLERQTVEALAADKGWALLGWDARETVSRMAT